ncbi:MAG: hypothetical protein M1829_000041 [Trizodia sp. TS-e1964]|nr:MAG: hypothetical protein M1829_000041 [Trizodia sp. TS-e1964]
MAGTRLRDTMALGRRLPPRSTRPQTSYREISSDDDSALSSIPSNAKADITTEDTSEDEPLINRRPAVARSSRATRSTAVVKAASNTAPSRPSAPVSRSISRSASRRPPTAASQLPTTPSPKIVYSPSKLSAKARKLMAQARMEGEETSKAQSQSQSQSQGSIPPWQSLPYHVIQAILDFASHPLCAEWLDPNPSTNWLFGMATLCRSFTQPALSLLYAAPTLLPPSRGFALVKQLGAMADSSLAASNNRIRVLRIEVQKSLTRKTASHSYYDLTTLVALTPRLESLELLHSADFSPYISSTLASRWSYPHDLFSVLASTGIHLRKWRWNAIWTGPEQQPRHIVDIHKSPVFQKLEDLALVNYPYKTNKRDEEQVQNHLSQAILELPNLKQLTLHSCTLLNREFLDSLPQTLTHFSIINCPSITSDILNCFLISHGQQLKELILDHNNCLSMAFLQDLALSCPKLEVLKLNMGSYQARTAYSLTDGEDLLFHGEVPNWPTKLRSIELMHLRGWDVRVASAFFTALALSSAKMPHLRQLILKAIINDIGWRDRARLRDFWIAEFERLFLRDAAPPAITAASPGNIAVVNLVSKASALKFDKRSPRRSSRPRRLTNNTYIDSEGDRSEADGYEDDEENGKDHHPRKRIKLDRTRHAKRQPERSEFPLRLGPRVTRSQDRRERRAGIPSPSTVANSDRAIISGCGNDSDFGSDHGEGVCFDSGSEESGTSDLISKAKLQLSSLNHQSTCDKVDVRIDNLRPTETQFQEGDFMDSEVSGDEEWDGGNEYEFDTSPAW